MSVKVYRQNGSIRVESTGQPLQFLNPLQTSLRITDELGTNRFWYKEIVNDMTSDLGVYTNVVDEGDSSFGTEEELITYLTSLLG